MRSFPATVQVYQIIGWLSRWLLRPVQAALLSPSYTRVIWARLGGARNAKVGDREVHGVGKEQEHSLRHYTREKRQKYPARRQNLSADGPRAVHERVPAGVLSVEVARLAGGHPQGGQGDAAKSPGRQPEPSRLRRPRILGNRSGDRTAGRRAAAQARRQDRRRPPAHRRRGLRLLRGYRRTDLAQTPGSPPDRHALHRGPGTPRTPRAHLPRRVVF